MCKNIFLQLRVFTHIITTIYFKISHLNNSNVFQTENELDCFINALLRTCLPSFRTKTIYIDVSEIIKGDIRTGIQRVVRNILRAFAENNVGYNGLRIEPCIPHRMRAVFLCRSFFDSLFRIAHTLNDKPIEPKTNVFLGLDLQPILTPRRKKLLMEMDARGIRIQFVVYDILPLTHKYFSLSLYFFLTGLKQSHYLKSYFVLVRIQKGVERFLKVFFPERLKRIKLEFPWVMK